jgi:EAL domain-containing protein (putative c-di-GMP-specific phosphodiesterase class I)
VAEETGLIHAVGRWVITEACRQLREWELHWPITRDLSMGVNLSVRQFQHPDLLEEIARALQDAGLAPSRLILEVTETVLIDGYHVNAVTLNHIKDLGVRIAIDDFGTGYSSLSYLKQLPVDMLKIDQAFVRGLGTSSQDGAIISAVVSLAHTLGLKVTAEGIETHAQLEYVQDLGCEVGQGFLFTPPMPASALGPVLFGPEATPFSARPDLALSFTQRRQRGVA